MLLSLTAFSQKRAARAQQQAQPVFPNEVIRVSSAIDSFNMQLPAEKLFIHTDKSYYTNTDTIWMKAYLLNGLNHKFSALSGLMYVELISDSASVIKRFCFPAAYGLSWGQIVLDPELFHEGTYTLRAYTNWMQNFGDQYLFSKQIYITSTDVSHWLVTQQHEQKGDQVNFAVQLRDLDDKKYGYKKVRWRVQNGKKILERASTETRVDGLFEGSFRVPDVLQGSPQLVVEADGRKRAVVPLSLDREEKTDLQFMPEGGYLVAGLPTKVAFKAIAENGMGVEITGKVTGYNDNEIPFITSHKGMGSFYITPEPGVTYQAVVRFRNGSTKTYSLPEVKPSGTVFRVINNPSSDSLRIVVFLSQDMLKGQTFKILGFSDGVTYYGSTFKATSQRIQGIIPKSQFPSGIVHFSLFNEQNEVLNERLTYVNHHDQLEISIQPQKKSYTERDSVSLDILVKNSAGMPVQGSFSLAVTADQLVRQDSLQDNIISNMLLSSGLKGHIEDPVYYLGSGDEVHNNLDLLLMTQGWKGYDWKRILSGQRSPAYPAEPDLSISGRVSNLMNKPLKNAKVSLMSFGKLFLMRDTLTSEGGLFRFDQLPPVDTISFFVQAKNARGKNFGLGLEVNEFKPALVSPYTNGNTVTPWYVNSDSTMLQYLKNAAVKQKEEERIQGKNLLNTVVVNAKKAVKNSKNLNGAGEADQIVDENAAAKARDLNMLDFLEKNVKGFTVRSVKGTRFFFIFDKRVRFIVDGVDADFFYDEENATGELDKYYNFILMSLNSVPVGEVKGVEVMYNSRYAGAYNQRFLDLKDMMKSEQFAYLEITTISGHGLFFKPTPGVATVKPLPISRPVAFYSPKYTPENRNKPIQDLRSTLFWEPNVVTDKNNGSARLSFYTGDTSGKYTVIVQGTDLVGLLGYKAIQLEVDASKQNRRASVLR